MAQATAPAAIPAGLPTDVPVSGQRSAGPAAIESRAAAEILIAAARREEALQAFEAELAARETRMAEAADALEAQIAVLRESEESLRATMALAERAAEDDIGRMVSVFETMKPEDAALVFTEMDPSFASGFLARLSPVSAGAILSNLDPRLAYQFSALVAGRNAGAPRN